MSDEVIKILDDLAKRFGMTIDWTSKNVTPYLKDLMGRFATYKMYENIVFLVVSIVAFILLLVLFIKLVKMIKKDEDYITFVMFEGFFLLLSLIACVFFTTEIIKCKTIPEMVVYEYIIEKRG